MERELSQLSEIKVQLRELLGVNTARRVTDREILELVNLFQTRSDLVECVLQSLVEKHFEISTQTTEEEDFVFVDKEELSSAEAGSGSMGCGSSYDYRSSTEHSSASVSGDTAIMICDMCSTKFTLMTRKKCCCECGNYFCSSCLPREQGCRTRTCSRCRVLHKSPPIRGDLMKLRVKDLQHFLTKKRINIKACVEKKDLVELVLQNSGVPSPSDEASGSDQSRVPPTSRLPGSNSWEDPSIRVSDQVPLERSGNFPQSYVDSSHRREWFQEKFGPNSESSTPSDADDPSPAMEDVTPVETFSNNVEDKKEEVQPESQPETVTNVENFVAEDPEPMDIDEVISIVVDEAQEATVISEDPANTTQPAPTKVDNISDDLSSMKEGSEDSPVEDVTENTSESEGAVGGVAQPPVTGQTAGAKLGVSLLGEQDTPSTPSSPRRFANQGMVYLSEIQSLEDLRELSTKQIKELLAMNRVNFKGCVEKDELLKIVERLWRQEQRNKEEGDTMDDDAMCKICMDSPIDCVMLECGHMCTCTNCGKQMAECPICRQYVVRVVKTFKA